MRKFSLVVSVVFLCSCWHQQWEDRVASGDTGSVTYGDRKPDTLSESDNRCFDCVVNDSWGNSETAHLGKIYCGSCHYPNSKRSIGPGLQGALERVPSNSWLIAFIRDEDSLAKTSDPYTRMLEEKYGDFQHHKFKKMLTNQQITSIIEYTNAAP
jgi:hypothetical protein